MTVRGKWRILEVPGDEADNPDMMGPAYIFFDGKGGGEFAFGCVTASLYGAADADTVDFFHRRDQIAFTARTWQTSSTAC